jgi:hypothetical protein
MRAGEPVKHSPGPWKVNAADGGRYLLIEAAGGGSVAALWGTGDGLGEADARLISAAPELLDLVRLYARYYCETEHVGGPSAPLPSRPCGRCDVCRSRALLARIDGEAKP